MILTVDTQAPPYIFDLVRKLNILLTQAQLGAFVSMAPYTVAAKPDATLFAWKLIFLSDGAGNKFVAVSDGTAWYYLEGTPV